MLLSQENTTSNTQNVHKFGNLNIYIVSIVLIVIVGRNSGHSSITSSAIFLGFLLTNFGEPEGVEG